MSENSSKNVLPSLLQTEIRLEYSGKISEHDILSNADGCAPTEFECTAIALKHPEFAGALFDEDESAPPRNVLAFGENLGFLKAVLAGNHPNFRGIAQKIQLIYIDPPFATGEEYRGNKGQKGYSAKMRGAEFLEFLRRRFILSRELLAESGFLVVRQAFNAGHYVKIILDEVFGNDAFVNEIVINRKRQSIGSVNKFEVQTESLFVYARSPKSKVISQFIKRPLSDFRWTSFLKQEVRNPRQRVFLGKTLLPPPNQHFTLVQEKVDKLLRDRYLRLRCTTCRAVYYYDEHHRLADFSAVILSAGMRERFKFRDITPETICYGAKQIDTCLHCHDDAFRPEYLPSDAMKVGNLWLDIPSYSDSQGYPTENSEQLLERIISSFSAPNEIVMDFFAGSGTTAVVAERLGRRWIVCDFGKLSVETTRRRLLEYGKQEVEKIVEGTSHWEGFSFLEEQNTAPENSQFFRGIRSVVDEIFGKLSKVADHTKFGTVYTFADKRMIHAAKSFVFLPSSQAISGVFSDELKLKKWWRDAEKWLVEKAQDAQKSDVLTAKTRTFVAVPQWLIAPFASVPESEKILWSLLKIPERIVQQAKPTLGLEGTLFEYNSAEGLRNAIEFSLPFPVLISARLAVSGKNILLKISECITFREFSKERNFSAISSIVVDTHFDGTTFVMEQIFTAKDITGKSHLSGVKMTSAGVEISWVRADIGRIIAVIITDYAGNTWKSAFQVPFETKKVVATIRKKAQSR